MVLQRIEPRGSVGRSAGEQEHVGEEQHSPPIRRLERHAPCRVLDGALQLVAGGVGGGGQRRGRGGGPAPPPPAFSGGPPPPPRPPTPPPPPAPLCRAGVGNPP